MPIEVRELVIRASVTDQPVKTKNSSITPAQLEKIKRELLDTCMEKVLAELKKERER